MPFWENSSGCGGYYSRQRSCCMMIRRTTSHGGSPLPTSIPPNQPIYPSSKVCRRSPWWQTSNMLGLWPNVIFFAWLLLHDWLWCKDRLQCRGWPKGYFFPLCMRKLECSVHLIWQCPGFRGIWHRAGTWKGCQSRTSEDWEPLSHSIALWSFLIANSLMAHRKGIRTMILMISWEVWKDDLLGSLEGKEQ